VVAKVRESSPLSKWETQNLDTERFKTNNLRLSKS